jgi:hypothetical protein
MSTHAASASRPQLKVHHGLERAHAFELGHEPPLDPSGGSAPASSPA